METLINDRFLPFMGELTCGSLQDEIRVFPNLDLPSRYLNIIGFLRIIDCMNSPSIHRCIIVPTALSNINSTSSSSSKVVAPSFYTLLSLSLAKTESVAIVDLGGSIATPSNPAGGSSVLCDETEMLDDDIRGTSGIGGGGALASNAIISSSSSYALVFPRLLRLGFCVCVCV